MGGSKSFFGKSFPFGGSKSFPFAGSSSFPLGKSLPNFGNSGRGVCEGPNFAQVDLALYKNIGLTQRIKAQLRFEVFNVFNRVNFMAVGLNTSLSPTSATLDTGRVATASTITAFTPSGAFGQATATRDPRQAQFGIKLTF